MRAGRRLRAVGFDDAPFQRSDTLVPLCGVVCAGTRFEGMLWDTLTRDGTDATETVAGRLCDSKFHEQVHLVLLDGLTFGGLNVVDLASLAERTGLPCVAVVRRPPDLTAFRRVVDRFADADQRMKAIAAAGAVHELGGFVFQVQGADPDDVAVALGALTDTGKVPEPLRLAHLIGAAVVTGSSGRRA